MKPTEAPRSTKVALHVARNRYHLTWDPTLDPIATVESGSLVSFDLLDASNGHLDAGSHVEDLVGLGFDGVDQVGGPIAVEGAQPGDVLEIELLAFEPAAWGWTGVIPGFGLLPDDFASGAYHVTSLGLGGGPIEFLPGIRLPRAPFCGVIGVAPSHGPLSMIPPDVHGGNMDTRHLVAGSTLFLPVFQPGARFSLGDGHATQGDGEVCGTAIETPMRATARLTVRKDLHLTAPEFEAAPEPHADVRSGRRYATDGIAPDLLTAARDAIRRMIDWLGRVHGIAPIDAYMLCSVAVDLRISEIVDMPNYVVTAYCPLAIFG